MSILLLTSYIFLFINERAELSSISLEFTKVKLSILNKFVLEDAYYSILKSYKLYHSRQPTRLILTPLLGGILYKI